MLLLAPDTIVTTGAGGVTVTRPIPDSGFTSPTYPAAPPPPVAPAYPTFNPVTPGITPPYTPYNLPIEVVTVTGGGGGLQIPVIPANIPPASPDNALVPNQAYNCGGKCGAVPLPSPGGAAGALNVSAAGKTQLGGVPWWVWLVMALLVVLVLAKK